MIRVQIFLRVTNSNRINNTVESFVVNGFVSSNTAEIIEQILQFYNSLYSEQFGRWPKLDGLPFDFIGAEDAVVGKSF